MSVPSADARPDPWRESLERSRGRRAAAARNRLIGVRARRLSGTVGVVMALGSGVALAAGAGPTAPAGTVLDVGSTGPLVAALQRALSVSDDGVYGGDTVRAVRAFQRGHRLTVDGVSGPATLAALGLRTRQPASRPADAPDAAPSGLLQRIAACESSDDPAAVSADGVHRGKYQFDLSTWRSVGGSGDPALAPEAEQDRLAAVLLERRGTAPWPDCA